MTITKTDLATHRYLKSFIRRKGRKPILKEIAKHFNLSSLGTVHERLKRLEKVLGKCPYCGVKSIK